LLSRKYLGEEGARSPEGMAWKKDPSRRVGRGGGVNNSGCEGLVSVNLIKERVSRTPKVRGVQMARIFTVKESLVVPRIWTVKGKGYHRHLKHAI